MFLSRSLIALLLAIPTADGQRVIRVLAQNQPVANAEVLVFNDSVRVLGAKSDADGYVRVYQNTLQPRSLLLVRRLGFAAVRRLLGTSDTVIVPLVAAPT